MIKDPHGIQFNQSAMRAHFDLCVDKEKKYMFSVSTRCRRKKKQTRRVESSPWKWCQCLYTCRLQS